MAENKEKQIQAAAERDSKFIGRKQRKHVKMVERSIDRLQNNIISMVSDLPKKNGQLIADKTAIKQAQAIHAEVAKLFETEWSASTRAAINEFSEVSNHVARSFSIVGESVDFTGVDKTAMKVLQDGYWQEYLNIGTQKRDLIVQSMYDTIIAGQPFDSLVTSIQQALVGQTTATGRPLAAYARLFARDQIMNYTNQVTLNKAEGLGFRHFLYVGNIIATSRDFCKKRAGKVYTRKEINSWDKQKWTGKSGHPFTHRGGYNCRHHWRPIRKEWIGGRKKLDIGNWDLETGQPAPPPKIPKKKKAAPKPKPKTLTPRERARQRAQRTARELKKIENKLFTDHRVIDNIPLVQKRIADNKTRLDLHRRTDKVFTDLKKRFPGIKKYQDTLVGTTSIGFTNGRYVRKRDIGSASSFEFNGVSYGDKIMIGAKNNASMKDDLFFHKPKRHNVGWSYECILRHELGHRWAIPTSSKGIQSLNAWSEGFVEVFGGRVDPSKVARAYATRSKTQIAKEVSEYGSSSIAEFFSETFAAYTSPKYKKGMLPKDIEDLFKGLEK